MTEKRGRPTLYTEELLKKADTYIKGDYFNVGHVIPSHQGLAEYLKITTETLYAWKRGEKRILKTLHDDGKLLEYNFFSDMLDTIMLKQHNLVIGKGLTGDFNSTIVKLVLAKHGYSEKTENIHGIAAADNYETLIERLSKI